MGVVNVTPDSFSDGGQLGSAREAADVARAMLAEGAALVDVGGESTRPGSGPVTPDEELRRVVPVLELLAGEPVSVDEEHRVSRQKQRACALSDHRRECGIEIAGLAHLHYLKW